MRQVPLEHDINITANGQFLVRNLHQEQPFMAMMISHSRGTCLTNVGVVHKNFMTHNFIIFFENSYPDNVS